MSIVSLKDLDLTLIPDLFPRTLEVMQGGDLERDASELLQIISELVQRTKKQGEMSIKITVKPGKGNQVFIHGAVKASKIPEEPGLATIMFHTPEGNLQREDPRQTPLRGVDPAPASVSRLK
jgi:hypothetical protein